MRDAIKRAINAALDYGLLGFAIKVGLMVFIAIRLVQYLTGADHG